MYKYYVICKNIQILNIIHTYSQFAKHIIYRILMPYRTTYIYSGLKYFFCAGQIIDFQIGKSIQLTIRNSISQLQQTKIKFQPVLNLFYHLFKEPLKPKQNQQSYVLNINQQSMDYLLDNEGLKIIMSGLQTTVNNLEFSQTASLKEEMILKVLVNILYTIIYYVQNKESMKKEHKSSQFLNNFYINVQMDNFLIRLLTMSLEVYFIPIKKITMLYTKVLANLFSFQQPTVNSKKISNINAKQIYSDQTITLLPYQNTLQEKYLQNLKVSHPPHTEPQRKKASNKPIEDFYRKHNMGDCPLAQSIVVGLLRSLLTICNSQAHKKFSTAVGAGADSFREWQVSYQYALENEKVVSQLLTKQTIARIQSYKKFDSQISQKIQECKNNQIYHEYYCHKIYTTSVITSFFMLILLGFKQNLYIQFSYFLQLISDANGILVLLKFLTDKFLYLTQIKSQSIVFEMKNSDNSSSKQMPYKSKVMLTVYSILNMLHLSCNNYPQKIKNYLFEYNSYLIIKKIPIIFLNKNKQNKDFERKFSTASDFKQDDQQTSQTQTGMMPSKHDLQNIVGKQQGQMKSDSSSGIMRKLTEVCYQLLKIQIPFFSKKMKDSSNHMKMVIDIYCRYPKLVEPIVRTNVQKLILKNRNKKIGNTSKQITMVEEMKTMHNEYNNLYYWSNDFTNQIQKKSFNFNIQKQKQNQPQEEIDYEKWLQQNVWKYYD